MTNSVNTRREGEGQKEVKIRQESAGQCSQQAPGKFKSPGNERNISNSCNSFLGPEFPSCPGALLGLLFFCTGNPTETYKTALAFHLALLKSLLREQYAPAPNVILAHVQVSQALVVEEHGGHSLATDTGE